MPIDLESVPADEERRSRRLLSAIGRLLERAADCSLEVLLRSTLDEAEGLTGSAIGFYHFVDADQENLHLQAWSTATEAVFCRAEGKGAHYPVALAGVWADCLRQRRPVIHNDYEGIAGRRGLPPGHARVVREMVVPVLRSGMVVAVLGVGNKAVGYDQEGVETVLRLADLAWHLAGAKRTLKALEESEARFRALTEQSPLAITVVRGLEVSYVNRTFRSLFGLPEGEGFVGRSLLDWIAPGERPQIAERARRREAGLALAVECETLGLRGDGAAFPIHLVTASVALPEGPTTVIFVLDLSERNQALQQRAQLESQLQQAQKLDSLGSLAGGIAHDMNNVLAAILAIATVHQRIEPEGGAAREAFATIAEAASRGGQAVRGLLNFARQSPVEMRELDLNSLLEEEIRLLERTLLAKVTLRTDLAADLRPILGDPSALTHAFMNLCVNAVDALGAGGELTLGSRNLDGPWIEVWVADNGSGMTREVQERALDPFFTTKEVGKGTGLGLPMVYSTIKAHGGQLQLQSEPGRGTRVTARFPASAAPALAASVPAAVAAAGSATLQVLLVDDDELVVKAMQLLLGILGHQVSTAVCGEAALALVEQGLCPDVVILDMNMPGIGGAGTLPRLRLLQPRVPVLLTTGRADQEALDLVEAHPGVKLLAKPYGMEELQKHLRVIAG